jgi:hypothetical protein
VVLPLAWKERLGKLQSVRTVEVELADQRPAKAEVCGPVKVQVEGFEPIFDEVAFIGMVPSNGSYEPSEDHRTREISDRGGNGRPPAREGPRHGPQALLVAGPINPSKR